MSEELTNAMAGMKEQEAISIAKDLIDKGEDPHKIFASCRAAMEIVGSRFEKGEYLCKMQVSDKNSGQVFLESTIQVLLR